MKKVDFLIKDINDESVIIELKEIAQEGDQIVLCEDSLNSFSAVNKWILNSSKEVIKQEVKEAKKAALNEFKTSKEYEDLIKSKIKFEADLKIKTNELELEKNKHNSELKIANQEALDKFKNSEEYQNLIKSKIKFEADLKIKTNELELEKNKHNSELKIANQEAIIKATPGIKESLRKDIEALYKNLNSKLEDEKKLLEKEISDLKNKKPINSKSFGGDFERWCLKTIDNHFGDDDFVKYEKLNPNNKNNFSAADILVIFGRDTKNPIVTITIECKTSSKALKDNEEDNEEDIKYNNPLLKNFLLKLEKNAKNNKSKVAILVGELGIDFKKIKNSPFDLDIYICHPFYLLPLLRIFNIFYKKIETIGDNKSWSDNNAKKISIKFMELFNNFQEKIIESLKKIYKQHEDSLSHVNKIINHGKKARDLLENKIQKKINSLVNIFWDFNPKFDKQFTNLQKNFPKLLFDEDDEDDEDEITSILENKN